MFDQLCEELKKYDYVEVHEYIESCDGWTYFKTNWEDNTISVKFRIQDNKAYIYSIRCSSLSDFVMQNVCSEIVKVLNAVILQNENKNIN